VQFSLRYFLFKNIKFLPIFIRISMQVLKQIEILPHTIRITISKEPSAFSSSPPLYFTHSSYPEGSESETSSGVHWWIPVTPDALEAEVGVSYLQGLSELPSRPVSEPSSISSPLKFSGDSFFKGFSLKVNHRYFLLQVFCIHTVSGSLYICMHLFL
jgi:hypothetical protein